MDTSIRIFKQPLKELGLGNNVSELQRQTNLDRSTISKMIDCSGSVQYSKIQALWNFLDDCLRNQGLPGLKLTDECFEESSIVTRRPQSIRTRSPQPSPIAKNQTLCQQVAEKLWTLDYREQERQFEDVRDRHPLATTICIEADDPYHFWITKRLVRRFPRWEQATILELRLRRYWDLSRLWRAWAEKLKLSTAEPSAVLAALAVALQSGSIILVLHGAQNLNEACHEEFLEEFWEPLLACAENTLCHPLARIVVVLTQGLSMESAGLEQWCQTMASDDCCPIRLDPLKTIPTKDVSRWLQEDGVYALLEATYGVERCAEILADCKTWQATPQAVFGRICDVFELESVVDFDPYWKLAG